MEAKTINTYLVDGFLDAGKTTYIQDSIFRDYFHKRGSTLILSFEEGETAYDVEKLAAFRTTIETFEGGEDISAFCLSRIEKHRPDRIYVELNAMREDLVSQLPAVMKTVFHVTLISGQTLALYYNNMRALLQNTITRANTVIFNRTENKEDLAPYATVFHLMNRRCTYLWESPMGYSEKAFGIALPFDTEADEIAVSEENYPVWFLDLNDNPAHYRGKTLDLQVQVRLRDDLPDGCFQAGRTVMTCCAADMQFLGLLCRMPEDLAVSDHDWLHIVGKCDYREDDRHIRRLFLLPELLESAPAGKTVLTPSA